MKSWPCTSAALSRLRAAWADYLSLSRRRLAINLLVWSCAVDRKPLSELSLRSYARACEDFGAELVRCAREAEAAQ